MWECVAWTQSYVQLWGPWRCQWSSSSSRFKSRLNVAHVVSGKSTSNSLKKHKLSIVQVELYVAPWHPLLDICQLMMHECQIGVMTWIVGCHQHNRSVWNNHARELQKLRDIKGGWTSKVPQVPRLNTRNHFTVRIFCLLARIWLAARITWLVSRLCDSSVSQASRQMDMWK